MKNNNTNLVINVFVESCEYLTSVYDKRINNVDLTYIKSLDFNQHGFLDRMVYFYGDHIFYAMDLNCGFIWNGKIWEKDSNCMLYMNITYKIIEFIKYEYQLRKKELSVTEEKEMRKWLSTLTNKNYICPIESAVSRHYNLTSFSVDFDAHDHLLTCKNGTLNLMTGELHGFFKENLLTQYVDIVFVPPNPEHLHFFQTFMRQTFMEDPELEGYMRRFLGSCLTGSNPDQIFTIFHGKGRNGKSIFTSLLKEMMPSLVQNVHSSTFLIGMKSTIRSDLARTNGYRTVIADESNKDAYLDEATVKGLTGNDILTARMLYKNEVSFRPKYKIILSTNYLPHFRGTDIGIKRRLRVVPFNFIVPEEEINQQLLNQFLGMKESIFYWFVLGAMEWYSNGLGTCDAVKIATDRYIQQSNSVQMFLMECCQTSLESKIPANLFYGTYINWCGRTEQNPVSIKEFSSELIVNNIIPVMKKRSSDGIYYHGIAIYR